MRESILVEAVTQFGSPLYVYDLKFLQEHAYCLRSSFTRVGIDVLYAMKANSNAVLLKTLSRAGLGFDACSVGEVVLLQNIGINPRLVHWNADAVSLDEMRQLARVDVHLTVGSMDHLRLLVDKDVNWRHPITLRINTGFGAGHSAAVTTGGELSKFGISLSDLPTVRAFCEHSRIRISGLHAHAGSGVEAAAEYIENARRLIEVASSFTDDLESLNFGGGFPYDYHRHGTAFNLDKLAADLVELSSPLRARLPRLRLVVEPGRLVVAEAGVLICTVTSVKAYGERTYVAIDSGFNHLARPFLYNAFHRIDNLSAGPERKITTCDIVGNLCQSGDVFARGREIAETRTGDLLCIRDVGAYGYAMSSNYNIRPRPAEVAIVGENLTLIRERETMGDLQRGQKLESTC